MMPGRCLEMAGEGAQYCRAARLAAVGYSGAKLAARPVQIARQGSAFSASVKSTLLIALNENPSLLQVGGK